MKAAKFSYSRHIVDVDGTEVDARHEYFDEESFVDIINELFDQEVAQLKLNGLEKLELPRG